MTCSGGAVAQLGERLVRNEKVRSSILLGSTIFPSAGVRRGSKLPKTLNFLTSSVRPGSFRTVGSRVLLTVSWAVSSSGLSLRKM